ncbi:CRISPR-associated protein, Csd2 family [Myxococcus fulvus]|uniref:CRISPR-associated protein, Csd2 family n=1 Tax=Myxococcus fulvus TaxID=33 RepID=A0A511T992_MYXFU|nr:type I-C CRISPR-associated protein Cas7/Csd2 [Myxococcus fulvus]GEN10729.1 type I-C CRISPR-associated protein Cas7/Csd2 [Myxococcus fulvus]SEU37748.1 CRISPR-associated protein, Csd2 family [Myxococcus fulvus]
MSELKNRHDFVLLFDVQDGNPNGDPDAGNLPRIDPETGDGLVTDVSLKRKVRNFVLLTQEKKPGFDIFVKEKAVLNACIDAAYEGLGIDLKAKPKSGKDGKKREKEGRAQGSEVEDGRKWMCKTFFDVRTFGAVMSTGANAGQVRGPVQLTFARSVSPIVSQEHSITRMAVATEAEAEKQKGDNRTMGRKNTVPYGLYRAHGFVSPHLAKQTGFSSGDLDLLFKALLNMFELDRSAARGLMSMRKVIVFKHGSELGNAPAHALFDRVHVDRVQTEKPVRSFKDYKVKVDTAGMPKGVEVMDLAG